MIHTRLAIILLLVAMAAPFAFASDAPDVPITDAQVLEERPDVAVLVMAAAWELQRQTFETPMVTFSESARTALRADTPRFAVMRFTESETNPVQTEVGVVMVFTDALFRHTSVSVLLTCTWGENGDHITVDTATVTRVVSPDPTMTLTIIPADRVPKDLLTSKTHAELLPWIIDSGATEEEFSSGAADECYLFAVVYDRLAPGDELGLLAAVDPAGLAGQAGNARDFDYNGWHVAMMQGTFKWLGDETFYIKVVHTPADHEIAPQVIGILSSQLMPVDSFGRPVSSGAAGSRDAMMHVVAGVLVAIGALIALLGYKLGRWFLAMVGLVIGAGVGYAGTQIVLSNTTGFLGSIEPFLRNHGVLLPIAAWAAILIPAVLLVILFWRVRWLGLLISGAGVGVVIGVAITGHAVDITSPVVLVSAGVLAILALVLRKWYTILFSAAFGAMLIFVGASQWFGGFELRGWYPACRGWTTRQVWRSVQSLSGTQLMMFILAVGVFALGVGLQVLTARKPRVAPADGNVDNALDEDDD
jgi:hypothetical protein